MTRRRVTANVPSELLEKALLVTGKGITETLIQGLEQVRSRAFHDNAMKLRGKIQLDVDLEKSRGRTVKRRN